MSSKDCTLVIVPSYCSSLPYSDKWWDHVPLPVVENADTKGLWDFNVFTGCYISARKPNVASINKNAKTVWVIDIAFPADRCVKNKETEKIDKYQELCLEIAKAVMEHEKNCNPNCCSCFGSGVYYFQISYK